MSLFCLKLGETAQSTELPETICNSSSNGGVCDKSNCFSCSSIKEAQSQKVRGTLLVKRITFFGS